MLSPEEDQKAKIRDALDKLDHADDAHWTEDGLPRTGVVQQLANDQTIKRSHINAAAPQFVRRAGDAMGDPSESTGDGLPAENGALNTLPPHEQVQPPQVMNTEADEDTVRDALLRNIHDAEEAISAAKRKITDGHSEESASRLRLERAKVDFNRSFPQISAMDNIKQHLAAEAQRRADLAGAPNVYGGKASQIDVAMSRGNSRGWGRPRRFADSSPVPNMMPSQRPQQQR